MIRDDNSGFYFFTGDKIFFMEQAGSVKCVLLPVIGADRERNRLFFQNGVNLF